MATDQDSEATTFSRAKVVSFQIPGFVQRSGEAACIDAANVVHAHGYAWKLCVYPNSSIRHNGLLDAPDPSVAVFLEMVTYTLVESKIVAKFQLISRIPGTNSTSHGEEKIFSFSSATSSCRVVEFTSREQIGCYVEDGTMQISVRIQIEDQGLALWRPTKPTLQSIKELSIKSCPIQVFASGKGYFVPEALLAQRAPMLLNLATGKKKHGESHEAVALDDVSESFFEYLLHYIYTGDVCDKVNGLDQLMDLLKLANRVACIGLKFEIEAVLIEQKYLDSTNAARLLLFAEAHCCALLLEHAIKTINLKFEAVVETAEWKQIEESPSLLLKLLKNANFAPQNNGILTPENMDVSRLRKELHAVGKDVDGTHETLVRRWKEVRTQQSVVLGNNL